MRFGCLGVWVFGCLGVWVFGCLGVWVFGCSGVEVLRCLGLLTFLKVIARGLSNHRRYADIAKRLTEFFLTEGF